MLLLTLCTADAIAVDHRQVVTVSGAQNSATVLRLSDGRHIEVREAFVEVLARWQAARAVRG
jgi:hypothetical protein